MEERFGYDEMNRLTGVWLGSAQTGASAYDGYTPNSSANAFDPYAFYGGQTP